MDGEDKGNALTDQFQLKHLSKDYISSFKNMKSPGPDGIQNCSPKESTKDWTDPSYKTDSRH